MLILLLCLFPQFVVFFVILLHITFLSHSFIFIWNTSLQLPSFTRIYKITHLYCSAIIARLIVNWDMNSPDPVRWRKRTITKTLMKTKWWWSAHRLNNITFHICNFVGTCIGTFKRYFNIEMLSTKRLIALTVGQKQDRKVYTVYCYWTEFQDKYAKSHYPSNFSFLRLLHGPQ